jgi:hypothetical protein
MQDSKAKLRLIQVLSVTLRWVLVATLSLSALMAQDQSASKLKIFLERNKATNNTLERAGNSVVGSSILSALPSRRAGAAFTDFQDQTGTSGTQATSPGRTYGTIIGVLIAAGAVAAFLVFSGDDGKKQSAPQPAGPAGTVITAGTPAVNPPSNR